MKPETVAELRKQFDHLVEELEQNSFCTSRDCMCEMAAPVVKLNAAITELEQEIETEKAKEAITKSYRLTPDML